MRENHFGNLYQNLRKVAEGCGVLSGVCDVVNISVSPRLCALLERQALALSFVFSASTVQFRLFNNACLAAGGYKWQCILIATFSSKRVALLLVYKVTSDQSYV